MPSRVVIAKELAEIFKVIAHPDRIRLIEELGAAAHDVNGLAEKLGLSAPRVSQHLSLLRARRMVTERREGRHHIYQLAEPELARWIVQALTFLEGNTPGFDAATVASARQLWTAPLEEDGEALAEPPQAPTSKSPKG